MSTVRRILALAALAAAACSCVGDPCPPPSDEQRSEALAFLRTHGFADPQGTVAQMRCTDVYPLGRRSAFADTARRFFRLTIISDTSRPVQTSSTWTVLLDRHGHVTDAQEGWVVIP